MKKEVGFLFLLGMLLVSHLVLAQEQVQTQNEEQLRVYSGFDRFIDNVRMFFTFGDNRVIKALDIREKELDSAIINTKNGDDEATEDNLKRARERLLFVQKEVSKDIADEVKININQTIDKIEKEGNLPDDFKLYILEEEKTQLTAELVIEVEGKEGQTLTRNIIKDNITGENKVKVVVGGEKVVEGDNATDKVGNVVEGEDADGKVTIVVSSEESKAEELEKRIGEIDEEIIEWVIKKGDNIIDEAPKTKDNEDVTPKPNIVDDDVAPGPQGIVGNQGYSDDEGHQGEIPDDTSGASGEIDED